MLAFVSFYVLNYFGNINFTVTDYDYQETRNLIDVCEMEHSYLINITAEFEKLQNQDIYRAYEEAREDYRDLKSKRHSWNVILIWLIVMSIALTYIITRNHYEKKLKEKKKKNDS